MEAYTQWTTLCGTTGRIQSLSIVDFWFQDQMNCYAEDQWCLHLEKGKRLLVVRLPSHGGGGMFTLSLDSVPDE